MKYIKPSPEIKRLRGDFIYNSVMRDIQRAVQSEDIVETAGLDRASVTTALIVAIGNSAPLRHTMEE